MFHDKATIHVEAGRGGHGGLSFRREKYVPRGGPDGGDGGRGGDVVFIADPALRDLSAFRRVKWLAAGNGGNGRGSRKHGADGETVEVRVPVGTQILDAEERIVADLTTPAATFDAARGGGGGRGNARFATPRRQTPRFAETGLPGEEADLALRLKLVVDAALAGRPNAGKSSLLRRISNAKPKVADYPFTTLEPVLGTVDGPDARQLTVADVPGLIEGAADGAGLGHEFLAHLERARLLVHVLDASAGELEERFRTVDRELAAYGAGLAERPQLVVLNKIDLLDEPPAFDLVGRADRGRRRDVVRHRRRHRRAQAQALRALSRRAARRRSRRSCPSSSSIDRVPAADRDSGSSAPIAVTASSGRRRRRPSSRTRFAVRESSAGPRSSSKARCSSGSRCVWAASSTRRTSGTWRSRGPRSQQLGLEKLLVLVVADPGHKDVATPAETRLELARLAFADVPGAEVELDPYARTVDSLEARRLEDATFVLGADEFADFPKWKRPERVLELVRLAVAKRPGVPDERMRETFVRLSAPDRISYFDLSPVPVSSSLVRERVARGEPIDDLVPPQVAEADGAARPVPDG